MVANVVIVRDSPQCFRIVFHARLFTFLVDHRYRATSIIPSHHEIIRLSSTEGRTDQFYSRISPFRESVSPKAFRVRSGFPITRETRQFISPLPFREQREKRDEEDFYIEIGTRGSSSESGPCVVDRESDPISIKICIVRRRGKRWSPIFGRTTETTSTRRVRMRVVKLNTRDPDALRINAKHVSRGLAIS